MTLPASAISYAPFGDSVFVRLGGARGDQIAVITGINPGDEVVTSGVQAPQRRRNPGQQQGVTGQQSKAKAREQLMTFTDLFVRRPVLAVVVNLVILIAGLQSIRALSVRQYPRSDIAIIRVSTVYVGANADLGTADSDMPAAPIFALPGGVMPSVSKARED